MYWTVIYCDIWIEKREDKSVGCLKNDTPAHLVAGAIAKMLHDKAPIFVDHGHSRTTPRSNPKNKGMQKSSQQKNTKTRGKAALQQAPEQGMDRYRIYALEKLLKTGFLNKEQTGLTIEELSRKCRVYGNGCIKHGQPDQGAHYLAIPEKYR